MLFMRVKNQSGTFPIKGTQGKWLKMLTPKQMLQILPITQVRAGNTCLSLLNEIRKIIHSLYREKEITKKVYNNLMNSIKLLQKYGYYSYEF